MDRLSVHPLVRAVLLSTSRSCDAVRIQKTRWGTPLNRVCVCAGQQSKEGLRSLWRVGKPGYGANSVRFRARPLKRRSSGVSVSRMITFCFYPWSASFYKTHPWFMVRRLLMEGVKMELKNFSPEVQEKLSDKTLEDILALAKRRRLRAYGQAARPNFWRKLEQRIRSLPKRRFARLRLSWKGYSDRFGDCPLHEVRDVRHSLMAQKG